MDGGATAGRSAAADWVVCQGCGCVSYRKRFLRALSVCPDCGAHHRLTAPERLGILLDPGSARPLDTPAADRDPLGFAGYPRQVAEARARTGLDEAVLCVRGRIAGRPVVAAVMDFRFLGGSLGGAVGDLLTAAADEACADRVPLLVVTASGGARMQEGPVALMQMARLAGAFARLDAAGVVTLSVITDPTYGGVAASFATLADVVLAETGARLGFAGPRVIGQTIGERLPEGFQTAGFLLERGLLDGVYDRRALRPALGRLLAAYEGRQARTPAAPAGARSAVPGAPGRRAGGRPAAPAPQSARDLGPHPDNPGPALVRNPGPALVRNPGPALVRDSGPASARDPGPPPVRDPGLLAEREPWDVVRSARRLDRPTLLDHAARLLEGFEELRGDRAGGRCPALVGGLGRFDGTTVMLIGHQKAHVPAALAARNHGMALPSGYRTAARLMRLAAKLGIPVVTLVDTPGAYPGVSAEEQGQAVAIAENLRLMSTLPVPVVCVVIGEGGSGGALGVAVADRVYVCENATYSVISPEGCASILWKDPASAPRAAAALGLVPRELLRLGVVDGVVPEPPGGAHTDWDRAADCLRTAVREALGELLPLDPGELVARRQERYRGMTGAAGTPPDGEERPGAVPAPGERRTGAGLPALDFASLSVPGLALAGAGAAGPGEGASCSPGC
ncbi:carboxyl transferase domain-containing protein [Streptomyces niveiscabiei]|uniref:carboxyl transferase domain-containing protein n=1 Tax=Streptomyces niveiscabiei TaxID=164115 RepID=UPI0029A9065D|nr:carboxyl transferase domain-containing protein [Streptomyces niveiscabiei]MDX3386250.1 carboxyl transferase domain-containing protein [Streptomyces niveiscabiei]